MDDLQTSDEVTFIPELIEPICFDAIEAIIKDKQYNELLIQSWVDEICSKISKDLIEANKPFKYLVTCTIMQKNGAGLHLGHSCYWDSANDNVVIARWPSEKRKDPNARMACMVTVYGLSY